MENDSPEIKVKKEIFNQGKQEKKKELLNAIVSYCECPVDLGEQGKSNQGQQRKAADLYRWLVYQGYI